MSLEGSAATPVTWTGKWIWQSQDGPNFAWVCFRKSFNLSNIPSTAIADISADSKYWMWINGTLAVFDGCPNRGPNRNDTYYDEVDIAPYLKTGANTVAILVMFWGSPSANSYNSSGKGGLVFQASVGGTVIASDKTWKMKMHPAYLDAGYMVDNGEYRSLRFNASLDNMGDWTSASYSDASWDTPTEKGTPPCAPWNNLMHRTIPLLAFSDLQDYANNSSLGLPKTTTASTDFVCRLPRDIQFTPYLEVETPTSGIEITMTASCSHQGFYVTKSGGLQTHENLVWQSGDLCIYTVPAGVTVRALKYRASGYNTAFAGSFVCNDTFYNKLWIMARTTCYVNMRDNLTDCPDRERDQWGDIANHNQQMFYAFDTRSHLAQVKFLQQFCAWRNENTKALCVVFPGNPDAYQPSTLELPDQSLALCSEFSLGNYYMQTGDTSLLRSVYPYVKDYLLLWTMQSNGLAQERVGDWDWCDWGDGITFMGEIDADHLQNLWYYSALKTARMAAQALGITGDLATWDSRIKSIKDNFDKVYWKGSSYASGSPDDRVNALAILTGIASSDKYASIATNVLSPIRNSSPFMEHYADMALCVAGRADLALSRMRDRYGPMVSAGGNVTSLWELFTSSPVGANDPDRNELNHGWNAPNVVLSAKIAGVEPEQPGWTVYHVLPNHGSLTSIKQDVATVKGLVGISCLDDKANKLYTLSLTSPAATTAIVGIPRDRINPSAIAANRMIIWSNGSFTGGVNGVSWNGDDGKYIKFNVQPGTWTLTAGDAGAVTGIRPGAELKSEMAELTIQGGAGSMRVPVPGVSVGFCDKMRLTFYNTAGRAIRVCGVRTDGTGRLSADLGNDLAPGKYLLQIRTGGIDMMIPMVFAH